MKKPNVLILAGLCLMAVGFYYWTQNKNKTRTLEPQEERVFRSPKNEKRKAPTPATKPSPKKSREFSLLNYSPQPRGFFSDKKYYVLDYNEETETPNWTCHLLTRKNVITEKTKRLNYFYLDRSIPTLSAKHSDYTRTGYDRGHMVPAEDFDHDVRGMRATFYMSNIAPQTPALNRGPWRELEEYGREMSLKYDSIVVVSGSVHDENSYRIKGKVSVPSYFYKKFYILKMKQEQCFLFPNKETTNLNYEKYTINCEVLDEFN